MGLLGAIVEHPEDLYALVKLKMAADRIKKQIPAEPHWVFSYTMLQKVSRSFALVIQQLGPELRNAVCIFYLVLRALDTVEDDTSIPSDIKVPILESFHCHIYERNWHFSCGRKDCKVLMDKFHSVSTAFSELGASYQEAIEDITKRMGAGMAKFICKEVETINDYDEYCHYVAGLIGLGLSKLFHVSGLEELAPDSLSNSMGLFLQDLKYEENSTKAVQCLNEMVTNALMHAEDCLQYMSALKDLAIFRFCAIPQIMAIGTLALCYNNVEVFRGVVKMRRGLTARVIEQTRSMSDVYGAFFEFSSLLKSKIDDNDPNASLAHHHVEAIQKACISSGLLDKRGCHMYESRLLYNSALVMVVVLLVSVLFAILSTK